jgi:hypothetical protein
VSVTEPSRPVEAPNPWAAPSPPVAPPTVPTPAPVTWPYSATPSPYPAPGGYYGYAPPPPPRPPAGPGLARPVAVEAVADSPVYGVAIVGVTPTTSGPAVASLVAGIASILVSSVVFCFGSVGAEGGWGLVTAGAFAILAGAAGAAGLVLGRTALRGMRRSASWGPIKGRGVAIAGMVCGGTGLVLTLFAVALAAALSA